MRILGIDVGGTGVKGGIVDTETGTLESERLRIPTPRPATPQAICETARQIARQLDWTGPIGCGIPGVVRHGIVELAPNLSPEWEGAPIEGILRSMTGSPVSAANDADVAGIAEMRFGAGRGQHGTVLTITLGTGIGSALFHDGRLIPNTELGHLELDGKDAERRAAANVRDEKKQTWKKWARRVDDYLNHLHALLWPELIIIGGGVSKKSDKFFPYITVPCPIVPAELLNEAGIVGAALYASQQRHSASTSQLRTSTSEYA